MTYVDTPLLVKEWKPERQLSIMDGAIKHELGEKTLLALMAIAGAIERIAASLEKQAPKAKERRKSPYNGSCKGALSEAEEAAARAALDALGHKGPCR